MDIPNELKRQNQGYAYFDKDLYRFYDTEEFKSSNLFYRYVNKVGALLQEFYEENVYPQIHFSDSRMLIEFFKQAIYIEEVSKYTEIFDIEVPFSVFFGTDYPEDVRDIPLNGPNGLPVEKLKIIKSIYQTVFSPFWQNEMYSQDACDGEELTVEGTVKVIEQERDNAKDIANIIRRTIFKSNDDGRMQYIFDMALYAACLQRVREKVIESDYTIEQSNYFNKTMPSAPQEKWAMIHRIADIMICSVENVLSGIRMRYYNDNDYLERTHAAMEKVKERNEELEGIVSALTTEKKLLLDEADRLRTAYNDVGVQKTKELKEELSEADRQNKQLQKQYDELASENERLLEYISILESEDEDDEENCSENILESDEFMSIADGRIIFVRSRDKAGYPVMGKLSETFPNAVFTNLLETTPDFTKADMVVILTKYVKHGLYWDARDRAKLANIICVQSDRSRLECIVKDMISAMNGNGGYQMNRSA
ncbi:MAG: hypothetical protein J6Y89_00795 [Lachnospiraceae bacterium]|nr:hypothetical protein [Lachnospiraceae bacterium]